MNTVIVIAVAFWAFVILSSIAWYAFLLFYIGIKGGRDIREMIRTLNERNAKTDDKT
jgi:hypothetical protein